MAETVAVAMAIKWEEQKGDSALIITDSQSTSHLFQTGAIPRTALRMLGKELLNPHSIIWCPADTELECNKRADRLAREISIRAPTASLENPPQLHATSSKTKEENDEDA